jgi:hypothetical protein
MTFPFEQFSLTAAARRIVVRRFDVSGDDGGSGVQCANLFEEIFQAMRGASRMIERHPAILDATRNTRSNRFNISTF